ncbi:hypothetical protein ES708_09825 [subsurface metagenome]
MGKLERIILWAIVLIAFLLAITNFVRISRNSNIIKIIGETQSYISELI